MAFPPPTLPTNRSNATPQQNNHPSDHNAIAQAINDTVTEVQTKANTDGDTFTGDVVVGGAPFAGVAGIHLDSATARIAILSGNASAGAPSLTVYRAFAGAADGQRFAQFFRGLPTGTPTSVGSIEIASSSSVSYNTTSDRRLKNRTGDLDDAASIVQTLGRQVYRGRWATDGDAGKEWVFVNSQDVEEVAPFAVSGLPDGVDADGNVEPQQLDRAALVPILLAALGEALDRLDALEAAD